MMSAREEPNSGCWFWMGSATEYGRLRWDNREALAHRISYTLARGPIPDGLQLDHLCRNIRCVNPAHLEPVTNRGNTLRGVNSAAINARKTHCKRGHVLAGDNLRADKVAVGWRGCAACRRTPPPAGTMLGQPITAAERDRISKDGP